jgi:hypothetical protein
MMVTKSYVHVKVTMLSILDNINASLRSDWLHVL